MTKVTSPSHSLSKKQWLPLLRYEVRPFPSVTAAICFPLLFFVIIIFPNQSAQDYISNINSTTGTDKAARTTSSYEKTLETTPSSITALEKASTTPHQLVGCLTTECIHEVASSLARAYTIREYKTGWCLPFNNNEKIKKLDNNYKLEGLVLVKVPKGASSTAAGVVIRIGYNQRCNTVKWQHRLAYEFTNTEEFLTQREQNNNNDNTSNPFVLTTIREPAKRSISTIIFHVLARKNITGTDGIVLRLLQEKDHEHYGSISKGQGGFQLRYVNFHKITKYSAYNNTQPEIVQNPELVIKNVRDVIQRYYNFIIVPERMDESLVVLSFLLQIPIGDVLVASSKISNSDRYHMLRSKKHGYICVPTTIPEYSSIISSKRINEFFKSNIWIAMNYGDYLLYEVANQSLDLTITETIGEEKFNKALNEFRTLRKMEQEQCAPHIEYPCSKDGKPQLKIAKEHCYMYYYDFGCGYKCIDKMIQEYYKDKKNNNNYNVKQKKAWI